MNAPKLTPEQRLQRQLSRKQHRVDALRRSADYWHDLAARRLRALQGLLAIVSDSQGVAGYHLNGEIADWDTFPEVEEARKATA